MELQADFTDKKIRRVLKALLMQISVFPTPIALNICGRIIGHFLRDIERMHGLANMKDARDHVEDSIKQGMMDEFIFEAGMDPEQMRRVAGLQ